MHTLTAQTDLELDDVARAIVTASLEREGCHVIALSGNLGAGKTALTKAIARVLGVTHTVTSPTFVIMQSYPIPGDGQFSVLTHIDAYRIDDEKELMVLGWEGLQADTKRLIVLEWPERVSTILPDTMLHVHIEIGAQMERIFTYGQ